MAEQTPTACTSRQAEATGRTDRPPASPGPTERLTRPASCAWFASIGLHAVLLAASGAVRFSSPPPAEPARPAPAGRISRPIASLPNAPVAPKPKITRAPAPGTSQRPAVPRPGPLSLAPVFQGSEPTWPPVVDSALSAPRDLAAELAGPAGLPGRLEFFGQTETSRKICYVVDCSGSMRGIFEQVRKRLKESIAALLPDQYFYIIFFGDGKLFESGQGRLRRATPHAKAAAYNLIDSVRPTGRTNASAALERVVRISDHDGRKPSVVYFLTDGFELTGTSTARFHQHLTELLKRFAPKMRINTMGSLPQDDDRRMLEAIAEQTGGRFICIGCGD